MLFVSVRCEKCAFRLKTIPLTCCIPIVSPHIPQPTHFLSAARRSCSFLSSLALRYGPSARATDSGVAAADLFGLWKVAVERGGSTHFNSVRLQALGVSFDGIQGSISLNTDQRVNRYVRYGKIPLGTYKAQVLNVPQSTVHPNTYNYWLTTERSKTCDWSSTFNVDAVTDDENLDFDHVSLGIMHAFTGSLSTVERNSMFFGEYLAIQEVRVGCCMCLLQVRLLRLSLLCAPGECAPVLCVSVCAVPPPVVCVAGIPASFALV